jgi:GNAT superfamily N-acetyltransferase
MALWRVRATIEDKPGFLAVLAASLALRSVNILAVQVHASEDGAIDDFLVDAPEGLTGEQLLAAVERGRGRDAWVAPADPHTLVDGPTRAIELAGHLARHPQSVGETLAELLDAAVTWQPVDTGFGLHGSQLRVPAPGGGSWLAERVAPSFTPAEYARAQALLEVPGEHRFHTTPGVTIGHTSSPAGPVGNLTAPRTLLLADGQELVLRRAGAADLAAVQLLHARCSPATLHRRYFSGSGINDSRLRRLLAPASGGSLVAEAGGEIVAMVNIIGEGVQAEVAVLVEDSWQHRGLGTALLRAAFETAAEAGFKAVVIYTGADNTAMLRTVRRLQRTGAAGRPIGRGSTERDGPVTMITIPLDPAAARSAAGPG